MAEYLSFSKESRFTDFCEAVKHCSLCPRLENRTKVLSKANGNLASKVLFIAEAPGRLGADKTGIPLFGDKTGDNFEALLGNVSWKRKDIFITNALLCNPRNTNGNNGTPKADEILNCSAYLEMTIELVQPEVIVTLGSVGLKALANIVPHNFQLRENVTQKLKWGNRVLIPLYHPGPRARVHRSFPKQTADFISLAKFVDPEKGIKNSKKSNKIQANPLKRLDVVNDFQKLILSIVRSLGRITYFKLTKLLYLVDLFTLERIGQTVTGEIYIRQQEGPWPPALKSNISALEGEEVCISLQRKIPFIKPGPSPSFEIDFADNELEIIGEVLERFGNMNNSNTKIAVYRTKPMRYILKQEKLGRDMRKVPVIYKNCTSPELDAKNNG